MRLHLRNLIAKIPFTSERVERAEYEALFRTGRGRKVLASILRRSGVFNADPRLQADPQFLNGARWLALEIAATAGLGPHELAVDLTHSNLEEEGDDDAERHIDTERYQRGGGNAAVELDHGYAPVEPAGD